MRAMIWTIAAAALVGSLAIAEDAAKKSFGKCPVSGEAAKEDASIDLKGKKVYFCCEGCPSKVEADAKPFMAKIHQQWAVTGQIVQVGCPFTGGKVNEKTMVELDGAKFGFCCEKCKAKYEKSDDKVNMVFADIKKGFTMQDKCPVSGKPINVKQKTEYKGKSVYFCCGNCPKAFEKDPEKFAAKLPKADDDDGDDDDDDDEDDK